MLSKELIEESITAQFGERCPEFNPECHTCKAWAELDALISRPVGGGKFKRGDRVRKIKGSSWQGRVVGEYSTDLTPEGYAVESENEPGSVQIYPISALEPIKVTERTVDGDQDGSVYDPPSAPVETTLCSWCNGSKTVQHRDYHDKTYRGSCPKCAGTGIDPKKAEADLTAATARIKVLEGDAERMDWLTMKTVNVRVPLSYGSNNLFWASPNDEKIEGEELPSNLREQIDAARTKRRE